MYRCVCVYIYTCTYRYVCLAKKLFIDRDLQLKMCGDQWRSLALSVVKNESVVCHSKQFIKL